jgi:tetratricopeptide (TPR) repeat protein
MPISVRLILHLVLALCLFAALSPAPSFADEKWIEVRSAHFTVDTSASDKDARKIADQFEQIRALFHAAFPQLRIDPAQQVVILAAKNEKGMKELLPEQWEVKGHMHAAGMYQQGFEKHYVILQLDAEGNNPYHALYHEYTHALIHLNFTNVPTWLDEGIAEYLGNAIIGDKESRVGVVDPGTLYVLQQNRHLPIETLLAVDQHSPYYNESNRVSIFYAESWALVHYLMLSPEARQKKLLSQFITAWDASHDQLAAARQTFGDLKKFDQVLDTYVRLENFYNGVVKNSAEAVDKQASARPLSPAEVIALRGDFFVHHNRLDAGKSLLDQAAKLDPALAFTHVALAFFYYHTRDMEAVQKEAQEALRLGDTGFFSPYLAATSILQHGLRTSDDPAEVDSLHQASALLEKSHQRNPNFAPTCDALANVYSILPDKQKAAIGAVIEAVKLDPSDRQYATHLISLLLRNNRDADAKLMADRLLVSSITPFERETAQAMVRMVAEHKPQIDETASPPQGSTSTVILQRRTPQEGSSSNGAAAKGAALGGAAPTAARPQTVAGVDGVLTDVDCSKSPSIVFDLIANSGEVEYHIADVAKILLANSTNSPVPTCQQWNGRRVRVWPTPPSDPKLPAEIAKLIFQ